MIVKDFKFMENYNSWKMYALGILGYFMTCNFFKCDDVTVL